jgi:hypothetical protein
MPLLMRITKLLLIIMLCAGSSKSNYRQMLYEINARSKWHVFMEFRKLCIYLRNVYQKAACSEEEYWPALFTIKAKSS